LQCPSCRLFVCISSKKSAYHYVVRNRLVILAHAIFGGVMILLPWPAFGQSTTLTFHPVAAELSTPLNRIIMISASPNQLHIYGPAGPSDVTVNPSKPRLSLA